MRACLEEVGFLETHRGGETEGTSGHPNWISALTEPQRSLSPSGKQEESQETEAAAWA